MKYKEVTLNGKVIGAYNSRSKNSSVVMCTWDPVLSLTYNASQVQEERPARVNYFAKHTVCVEEKRFTHLLFSAAWFKHHPKQLSCGSPISVWQCDIFDLSPVSKSRTVSLVDVLDNTYGQALFVIPCIDF